MNVQIRFLDCNSSPLPVRKVLFTPVRSPEISASWLTTADSYQFTTSLGGVISASIVANNYKVDIGNPTPETSFYLTTSETGSCVYSSSYRTGSSQCVFFDLFNLVKDPTSVRKLTLTPAWNYPVEMSGSIYVLCSTASVPVNGYVSYSALLPGPYLVDALGKIDTTFYISVPAWPYTGSTAPCWNAKDLLIVKPSKGIPVKLYNADNSYVLTVSSSDARYVRIGASGSFTVNSCSYANQADNAVSSSVSIFSNTAGTASYITSSNVIGQVASALVSDTASFVTASGIVGVVAHSLLADTASYVLNAVSASYVPNLYPQEYLPSASWASSSISASYADTASFALNATPQESCSWASASISSSFAETASYADVSVSASYAFDAFRAVSASYAPASGVITNAETASYILAAGIDGTVTSASYSTTASFALNGGNSPSSSWASSSISASYAATASVALNAVPQVSCSWASSSISASHAVSASFATSASYANVFETEIYTIYASYAITSSWSETASYVSSSNVVGQVSQSLIADTASYFITSSVTSASYVPNLYPQEYLPSASWASASISASYAVLASDAISASYVPNLYPQVAQDTVPSASWVSASVHITNADTASYFITSSVTSASYAVSSSYVPNLYPQVAQDTVPSASWVSASAHITNADTASYFITSSVTSASYAISASYVPNLYPQEYLPSASWASASISASYARLSDSASYYPPQQFLPSASWASESISASYARLSDSASYYPPQQFLPSASWASESISASHADNADRAISASYAPQSGVVTNAETASYILASGVDGVVASASYAYTASVLLGYAPTVSASWASQSLQSNNATQSLYATNSISASVALTASYLLDYAPTVSASWASSSISASYAVSASWAPDIQYPSASWASSSISASYSIEAIRNPVSTSFTLKTVDAVSNGGQIDFEPSQPQYGTNWSIDVFQKAMRFFIVSGSTYTLMQLNGTSGSTSVSVLGAVIPRTTAIYDLGSNALRWNTVYANNLVGLANFATSASFASASISASWAPTVPSDTAVSASWASSSISASYSETASYALNASTPESVASASWASASISASYVPNLYPQEYLASASWASSSISASYADVAVSASYVPNLYPQEYLPSASWASASISASYVPNLYPQEYLPSASWASASLSASYVPNLYPQEYLPSASWASASISAQTAVVATSASFASASISTSYSAVSDLAQTASYLKGRGEVSSSLLFQAIADPIDEQEGRLFYSSDTKALTIMGMGQTRLQLGQEEYTLVYNNTGEQIDNGTLVAFSGEVQGAEPCVKKAIAGIGHEFCVLGMTTMDIPDSSQGLVTTYGMVNGIDTSGTLSGSVIYLSDTVSGSYTTTEPPYPYAKIRVGAVIKQHSNGSIYIRIMNHSADAATTASYAISASRAEQSLSASNAAVANAISFIPQVAVSASWVSASVTVNSASYASTASFVAGAVVSGSVISASHANALDAYELVPLNAYGAGTGNSLLMGVAAFSAYDKQYDRSILTILPTGINVDGAIAIGTGQPMSKTSIDNSVLIGRVPGNETVSDVSCAVIVGAYADGGSGSVAIGYRASASYAQADLGGPFITSTILRGNVSATGGVTASLQGTASYALTASVVLGSVVTASYANIAQYSLGPVTQSNGALYYGLERLTMGSKRFDPTGFADGFQTTMSYDPSRKAFQITQSNAYVYTAGKEFVKQSEEIILSTMDTGSLGHVYYAPDTAVLSYFTAGTWDISSGAVPIATVYFDGTNYVIGRETHGIQMDGATQEYLHETFGPRYASGYPLTHTGSNPNFIVGAGHFYDDDVGYYDQELSQCRITWHSGSTLMLVTPLQNRLWVTASDGTGRIAYDNLTTTASVAANRYVAYWLFGVNGYSTRLVSVMGQRIDTSVLNAQANNTPASLTYGTFPLDEAKLFYRLIYDGNGNLQDTTDFRQSLFSGGSYTATDHGTLTGLADDDHQQYLLLTGRSGGATVVGGITASLQGTASCAETASFLTRNRTYEVTASMALTASSINFIPTVAVSASWASSSISSSFASTVAQQISLTGLTASAAMVSPSYQMTQSYASVYGADYTISNTDNGKVIVMTGSANTSVTLTATNIDAGWSAMFYQSGSGRILFTTASTAVVMRNRSSFTGSAGQYAVASVFRVPNGDFILAGDMASS